MDTAGKRRTRPPAEDSHVDTSVNAASGSGAACGSEGSSKRRAAEDSHVDTSEDSHVDTSKNTANGSGAACGSGVRQWPQDSAKYAEHRSSVVPATRESNEDIGAVMLTANT